MRNFNIGLLGHVDSGKTTLAKALSTISSTACFDKNPQSKERGITLDLGFSSSKIEAPEHIRNEAITQIQLTFVDCPGHASLIRTIIGGAQIVDLMILVVDAQRGIQTQTAECIVIGELLQRRLIVAINKIDLLTANNKESHLNKLKSKLRKTLEKTAFGSNVPIFNISAQLGTNIENLLHGISSEVFIPERDLALPLLIYVDHCFLIKGHGTVCTGTVVQGKISIGDTIEIPQIGEQRKVKTMQAFKRPVEQAVSGDRVGICVTQFNVKSLERGVIAAIGYLKPIYAVCLCLERIVYYKYAIRQKSKFHITVGHETVMGIVTSLFRDHRDPMSKVFEIDKEYEFIEEFEENQNFPLFALIEFEKPVLAAPNAILIASKLDLDVHSNSCRLAFWGQIQWFTYSNQLADLSKLRIFKQKKKEGNIQRIVNDHEIIVQNLFKKETDPDIFIGKSIELSTGELGTIECKFGKGAKVKVILKDGLKMETKELQKNGKLNDVLVTLIYKKYILHNNRGLCQ